MATPKWRARRFPALPDALDLLAVALFVLWFYYPFFGHGYPVGDFASTIGVGAAGDDLVPTPWSFPTWDPNLMCGRPAIEFMSPFHLLTLPFGGLEPILRMKGIVVLYNVLSGLTMYWLLAWSGAGRLAATFGGMIYPIMAAHVSRTAIHGHIHLPMFWTVLPLILLGLLRLRPGDRRGIVILGLLFALGFVRDTQRTVLTFVAVMVLVGGLAVYGVGRALATRNLRTAPHLALAMSVTLAFALGVVFDAFELVNGYLGDPFRGGWRGNEQHLWMDKWSLDNLYTLVDRATWLGDNLGHLEAGFYASTSRYVGLSLLALCLYGGLAPAALGPTRRRFWFVLALFPISVWLSFGRTAVWAALAARWRIVFASPEVAPGLKAMFAVVGVGTPLLLTAIVARNLAHAGRAGRWRWPASLAIVGGGLAVFLGVAPLPIVTRVLFFLRDFRNPDWFQVTLASCAVAYGAALALGAIVRQLSHRPRTRLVAAIAITVVAVLDMWWYRRGLTSDQRSFAAVDEFRALHQAIGADPDDFRVLAAEAASANVDIGYAWNRKRLAWDFRSYTAPRHTQAFVGHIHDLLSIPDAADIAAVLAGIANVKYVIDEHDWLVDIDASPSLRRRFVVPRMTAYQNQEWRPWVQAYPGVGLVISDSDATALSVIGELTPSGYGFLRAIGKPSAEQLAHASVIYHDPKTSRPDWLPAGSVSLRARPATPPLRSFVTAPTLAWTRPRNEEIRVTVTTAEPALIVVAESYHPWWRLWVNGSERPLEPAQFAFLGAVVDPGASEIVLRFRRPWTFYACGWVSLLTTAAALGYLLKTRGSSAAAGAATLV